MSSRNDRNNECRMGALVEEEEEMKSLTSVIERNRKDRIRKQSDLEEELKENPP